jgi:arylsulfatase A-like enzyme
MASVFTGLEVERVPRRAGPGLDFTLAEDARTVAEELRDRGYDTVGFTLSEVAQHIHGIGQGFRVWKTPWQRDDPPYAETAERTTDAALAYLATATQPYLLFAHYGCTHEPYVKHAEHDFGDKPVDVYDSALAHCDAELGRLFAALEARADRDRTAVIVYSDHGELFGEHGFDHHGTTLYQPDVRVLLMAKVPGGRAGAVVTEPVTLTDIGPTVLALAGARPPSATSAWSLLPYVRGDGAAPSRPVFLYAEVYNGPVHFEAQGVVSGGCKLLRYAPSGTEQLFDLRADPSERHAESQCDGETAGYFRDLLDGWSAYVQPESPRQPAHEVGLE